IINRAITISKHNHYHCYNVSSIIELNLGGFMSESAGNALISVYDKTGIVEFAGGLVELDWKVYASGGTATAIAEADIPVTKVADLTGWGEMLDHRVVTLHPKVHGGILA